MQPVAPHATAAALGHLAAWVALYVAAWVVVAAALLRLPIPWLHVGFAALVALGTYLFDRVKHHPEAADPADALAHPARARFLAAVDPAPRVLMAAAALAAGLLGWVIDPRLLPLVPLVFAAVYLYGSASGRPRVKDRLLIKNLAVGIAIAGFVMLLALHHAGDALLPPSPDAVAVGGYLLLHVTADAMLCDIDDAAADARHGTRTIPNRFAVVTTWRAALALTIGAGAALLALARPLGLSPRHVATLVIASVSTTLILRELARRAAPDSRWLRDAVDARAALLALLLLLLPLA